MKQERQEEDASFRLPLKDLVELGGSFVRWGSLSMGGLCLLIYSNEIGQFPEGLNLGEGLAFYLVCAGFWLVYSLYVVILTALGSVLMAWPARVAYEVRRRKRASTEARRSSVDLPVDFSPMYEFPCIAFGLLGLLVLGIYAFSDAMGAAVLFALALLQGLFVATFLLVRRRHIYLASGLLVHSDTHEDVRRKRATTTLAQRVVIGFIVVAPLVIGSERFALVDAAFRTAQLRKEKAVIHVKKPWSTRVASSKLVPGKSFLGEDYEEFREVKVLLRSVGEKVVIELPQTIGRPVKLPIPSSEIFVE